MKIVMMLAALTLSCQCKLLYKINMQDHQDRVIRFDKNVRKMITKEKSAFPTIRLKRRTKRQSKERNSLLFVAGPPKLFSGKLADVPETVLKSKPGTVVKDNGVLYIWHQEQTPGDCYMACRREAVIACQYYLYADAKCIMTEQDYVKLPKVKTPGISTSTTQNTTSTIVKPKARPGPEIGKSSNLFAKNEDLNKLEQMIEKIDDRLDTSIYSLKSGDQSRENHMHGLQVEQNSIQRILTLLSDKVKTLNNINPKLIKQVELMDSRQEGLVEEIQNMGEYENQIANALNNVDSKVTNLDGNINSIKQTNEKIFRRLSGEDSTNPEYNKHIIELRRQMMKLVSKIEMNPTVIKMTKNQRVLAKALEAIDREIIVNQRRLTHLDDSTSSWGGRLIAEEEQRKLLNDALQTLNNAVKDARNDLMKLHNPQSSENAEKAKEMRQIRSDIQILERSNAKLEQDMIHAKLDLTRLVKDLVNVQVSAHTSKASVIALVEANKNLALDFHQLKTDQNQMITEIETLATVYRSVLAALHSLELKQIQVMHHLGRYEHQMRSISNEFLGDGKYSDSDFIGIKQMFRDFPLLFTMKNFQTKLLKQIYLLKSDLNKVQQHLNIKQEEPVTPVPPTSTIHEDKKDVTERKDYSAWKNGRNSPDLFRLQRKPKIPGLKGYQAWDNGGQNLPDLFSKQENQKNEQS